MQIPSIYKNARFYLFSLLCSLFLLGACGGSLGRDTYRIGIDPSWYPLEIPGRTTNLSAFFNALFQKIADEEHLEFTRVTTSWNTLLTGLTGDKHIEPRYEAIVSSMQPYIFNQKQYDFSTVALATGPVVVLPVNVQIDSLDMLKGKEIAVLRGSSNDLILEKYPGIIIRIYDSIPQALNDILAEVIDGAVVDILTAQAYCQDLFRGQLAIATPPLNDQGLRLVALHEKATPLITAFNRGLEKLKKNGTYDSLKREWGL